MARKTDKISESGKNFIRKICSDEGQSLLSGNNGPLPFSNDGNGNLINKTWTVTSTFNGQPLTKNNLADALITWIENAANIYALDPNVLAAQAYVESGFRLWYYEPKTSGSGLFLFSMADTYSVVINKFSDVRPFMSEFDIVDIINGLTSPLASSSYNVFSENDNSVAIQNRPILHQNIINYPEIMIRAQARYMKYFSDRCANLASTSLFCYNRGSAFCAETYSRAIQKLKQNKGIKDNTDPYLKEGLDYVLKVFGVLGDKYNYLSNLFKKNYKPQNYYFGYDDLFNTNNGNITAKVKEKQKNDKQLNDLITYPNENFSTFDANVKESEQYNIDPNTFDNLSISSQPNYKFIYFPEDQYIKDETNKLQIVLHHTVSGDGNEKVEDSGVAGDIKWWRSKGERVATSFIIARDGKIYQLFNTNYWAHHLGIKADFIKEQGTQKSNQFLNERSIGIEIDSWGGLVYGTSPEGITGWYPTIMYKGGDRQSKQTKKGAKPILTSNVQEYNSNNNYPKGFRGYYGFEKYTDEQIKAVQDLIISIKEKFPNIDLSFKSDMWDINYDANGIPSGSPDGGKGVSKNALNGVSGIWTHVSYRDDKSDCHPQPDLVSMLRKLDKGNVNNIFNNNRFFNQKNK